MSSPGNDINAYILAGGQSTRMNGFPKGLLELDGKPLVQHIAQRIEPLTPNIYLNANHPDYHKTGLPVIPDPNPQGNGPLEGIITCLDHSDKPFNFIVACDMPNLNGDFLKWFNLQLEASMSALVPYDHGEVQPLCGFYHKTVLDSLKKFEAEGIFKLKQVLVQLDATLLPINRIIPGYHENLFANINHLAVDLNKPKMDMS